MEEIKLENGKLSYISVIEILRKYSPLFTPPLSQSLDLEEYSAKLFNKANFVIYRDQGEIKGLIAYYNNKQKNQVYITLICVDGICQSHGIGSKMLDHLVGLINRTRGEFDTIALEVNKKNYKALRFYTKHGFIRIEDRGEKVLMEKML